MTAAGLNRDFDILGVRISNVNLNTAVEQIERWIKDRFATYVCVAPVATIIDCQDDKNYQHIVNAAGMTTPDGMPIVWLGRWKGSKVIDRTYGPDLMNLLCSESEARGYRHFFYGGTPETNRKLGETLKKRFPKLQIVGQFAPGYLKIGQPEQFHVIDEINKTGADILWVGLGSPKQDYWMSIHRDKINIPVMIGAGAAFDFIAGTKPQAPIWLQHSGFEWLFRLCCEPRRLWKRYLIGNTRFLYLILTKELFRRSSVKAVSL